MNRYIIALICSLWVLGFTSGIADDNSNTLGAEFDRLYRSLPEEDYQKAALELRWIGYCFGVKGLLKGNNEIESAKEISAEIEQRIEDKKEVSVDVIFELGEELRTKYAPLYKSFKETEPMLRRLRSTRGKELISLLDRFWG